MSPSLKVSTLLEHMGSEGQDGILSPLAHFTKHKLTQCDHPYFAKLSTVRIFCWMRIKVKIQRICSLCVLSKLDLSCADQRLPQIVHGTPKLLSIGQVMVSSPTCYNWTDWRTIQSKKSSPTCVVLDTFLRALIQFPFCNSCFTDLLFRRTRVKKCGAKFLGSSPLIQLSCKNHDFIHCQL